jgi:hypothetical protein
MSMSVSVLSESDDLWSIHREAPEFTEQSTEQEILATGIKVRAKESMLLGNCLRLHCISIAAV